MLARKFNYEQSMDRAKSSESKFIKKVISKELKRRKGCKAVRSSEKNRNIKNSKIEKVNKEEEMEKLRAVVIEKFREALVENWSSEMLNQKNPKSVAKKIEAKMFAKCSSILKYKNRFVQMISPIRRMTKNGECYFPNFEEDNKSA